MKKSIAFALSSAFVICLSVQAGNALPKDCWLDAEGNMHCIAA